MPAFSPSRTASPATGHTEHDTHVLRVCILGTGNYAKAIGTRIAHAGLPLVYGSRRVAPEEESNDDSAPTKLKKSKSKSKTTTDTSANTTQDPSAPHFNHPGNEIDPSLALSHPTTMGDAYTLSLDSEDEHLTQPAALSINDDPAPRGSPATSIAGATHKAKSRKDREKTPKTNLPSMTGEPVVKAPCDAVKGADLIIMAIPITGHAEMASLIQNHLSSDAVIIDVSNTTFSKSAAQRHAEQMEASIAALEASYAPTSQRDARKFAHLVRKQKRVQRGIDKLLHPHTVTPTPQSSSAVKSSSTSSLTHSTSTHQQQQAHHHQQQTYAATSYSPALTPLLPEHHDDPSHKLHCTDPCCNPEQEGIMHLQQSSVTASDEKSPLLAKPSKSTLLSSKSASTTNVVDIENIHKHPRIADRNRAKTGSIDRQSLYSSSSSIEEAIMRGCASHGYASCNSCQGHMYMSKGVASTDGSGDTQITIQCPAPWNQDCLAYMSNAEHLQRLLPRVTVVKAFNTISAYALLAGPGAVQDDRVLVCGDKQWAKERVFSLIHTMGMRPVDAGPLMSAREVEKRSVVFFQDWRAACWISAALFLLAAVYIAVRDIALVKGYWPDLFLLKFNVIIAWHALALFTATFLAGATAALRQLTTGTAKIPFPDWMDKWLRARKSLGLMALASSVIHMIAAVITDHLFVDFGYVHSKQGAMYQSSIFAALLSLIVYSALAATSIPSVGSNLSWREWTFVQSKLGIVGLALGAAHGLLMVFALGELPSVASWPYYLPPAGLIVTGAAIALILIRIILAIPIISKRLDRIRGGT